MQMKNHEKVIKSHSTQLVRYDAMCRAIESCEKYDEVKEIRDKAVALECYAAQALNKDAEHSARVIRVRAERRAGQMLKEGKRKGQILKTGRPKKNVDADVKNSKPKITDRQSSQWQQLAANKSTVTSWRRAIELMEGAQLTEPLDLNGAP